MARAETNPRDLVRFPILVLPVLGEGEDAMKTWAASVNRYLTERMQTLEAMIGGGLRWQNLRSNLISGVSLSGGPATESAVAHDLGKIPEFIFFMTDVAAVDPFVSATHQGNWTTQTVEFGFVGNGNVTLLVI